MTVALWQRADGGALFYDVCIIGTGITGVGLAWWLRRRSPTLRIALIEARTLGAGASGRNAGMVLAGLADHYDRMIELYGRERAQSIWFATLMHQRWLCEFVAETGADVELEKCGSWRVAFAPDEREHLERSFVLLREDGFEAEFSSRDPLSMGFHGALGIRGDMGIHPLKLVRALWQASGAELFENCEAERIDPEANSVRIRSRCAEFTASRVFIALNAYAPFFHPHFRPLVAPQRGQILVTEPLRRFLDRLVYAHYGYIYFRQLRDGRLLLGGFRHLFAGQEQTSVDEVTPEVQGALESFLREKLAVEARIEARWAGAMGFSPDGLPIIGVGPESDRVIYALGFTGHGFGLALEVARRAVLLSEMGEADHLFGSERFGARVDQGRA
jgi:gamma-glutamylputrescine oxidase